MDSVVQYLAFLGLAWVAVLPVMMLMLQRLSKIEDAIDRLSAVLKTWELREHGMYVTSTSDAPVVFGYNNNHRTR